MPSITQTDAIHTMFYDTYTPPGVNEYRQMRHQAEITTHQPATLESINFTL
jgi:hypothetical protein